MTFMVYNIARVLALLTIEVCWHGLPSRAPLSCAVVEARKEKSHS